MKKLPPAEKIPEAWTAIVDGRVHCDGDIHAPEGTATVASSDGAKTYTVTWQPPAAYTSNDNGTYWRGYPGYPIVAVMMLQGILPYDEQVARLFAGVDWNALNAAHRADYGAALQDLMSQRGIDAVKVNDAMASAMQALRHFDTTVKRGKPLKTPTF